MSFIDFARAHGVDIDHSKLYPSDRIKRTGTVEKPKSGNGAYFWDGQRGWVFEWSGEARTIWYEDPHAKPWTDEEKRAWVAKRRTQQTEQQEKYEQVAIQAENTLRTAKLDLHNYLAIKGFKDEKGLVWRIAASGNIEDAMEAFNKAVATAMGEAELTLSIRLKRIRKRSTGQIIDINNMRSF